METTNITFLETPFCVTQNRFAAHIRKWDEATDVCVWRIKHENKNELRYNDTGVEWTWCNTCCLSTLSQTNLAKTSDFIQNNQQAIDGVWHEQKIQGKFLWIFFWSITQWFMYIWASSWGSPTSLQIPNYSWWLWWKCTTSFKNLDILQAQLHEIPTKMKELTLSGR